jgi:hypothetical protein
MFAARLPAFVSYQFRNTPIATSTPPASAASSLRVSLRDSLADASTARTL